MPSRSSIRKDYSGRRPRVSIPPDRTDEYSSIWTRPCNGARNTLLAAHCTSSRQPESVTIENHPVLDALTPAQVAAFAEQLETRTFARGERIAGRGDSASGFYLILRGKVSSAFTDSHGIDHRIVTLSAGMTFGEMTLFLGTRFLNDIRADSTVTVAVLTPERYEALTAAAPKLKLALLERLATGAYEQLDMTLRSVIASGRVG
ncbi:hypothetical protein ABH922_001747 [Rhodococcus sp. 27YEA15]